MDFVTEFTALQQRFKAIYAANSIAIFVFYLDITSV